MGSNRRVIGRQCGGFGWDWRIWERLNRTQRQNGEIDAATADEFNLFGPPMRAGANQEIPKKIKKRSQS